MVHDEPLFASSNFKSLERFEPERIDTNPVFSSVDLENEISKLVVEAFILHEASPQVPMRRNVSSWSEFRRVALLRRGCVQTYG